MTIRQSKHSNQIRELSARLEEHVGYGRIQGRINKFIVTLNLDSKEDLETFRLVRDLMPCAPSPLLLGKIAVREENRESYQQLIDVDGETGWLEVLSLSKRPLPHPSHDYSVNVLFYGIEIVDVLIVGSTPMENFDVEVVDYNGVGMIDLIVRKQIIFAKEVSHYEITPNGFIQRMENEIAE